jgi:hypothetical protein
MVYAVQRSGTGFGEVNFPEGLYWFWVDGDAGVVNVDDGGVGGEVYGVDFVFGDFGDDGAFSEGFFCEGVVDLEVY